ncbi:hypothetical protein [Yersinia aleksiciae]|nr:hypothetical protein [Yersinia aleksiciae]
MNDSGLQRLMAGCDDSNKKGSRDGSLAFTTTYRYCDTEFL